jgi:nucleotide-binding universal stress UspA family protein
MTELRRIVAATDLSAPARRAADRAARLARAASASLTLLLVVSRSGLDELRRWLDTGEGNEQSLLDEVRTRQRTLASELGGRHQIDVDHLVVIGNPVDEIVRVAGELQADLIVTGTLGSGFLRNRLFGSTAERVVRKSPHPVLMVRQAAHEPYRRVLLPVDFSPWSARSVEMAAAIAPDAHFVLMHALEAPFEGALGLAGVEVRLVDEYRAAARSDAMRGMRELAQRAGLADGRWSAVASDGGGASTEIIRQEQEQTCDLIALGKHGRNAAEDVLFGSTTNRVIGESSSDVLVSTRSDAR